MNIVEVKAAEYRRLFPRPIVAYNSVGFTELNAAKADRVRRVVIESDKPLLGLTVGERGGKFHTPFSAPFACFDFNREHSAGVMLDAAVLLRREFPGMKLILPPAIYSPSMINKALLALLASGARLESMDWNYYLDLSRPFVESMTSAARNKMRQAERLGAVTERCDVARAYEVIRRNRRNKGYDLAMTLEQVAATTAKGGPVQADFFVMTAGHADIAAAIIYRVTPHVAQVIYWGDDNCPNATNLLAHEVASFYVAAGFKILDVGPSGADGRPNLGLSDFKDSIGCITSPKPTLIL